MKSFVICIKCNDQSFNNAKKINYQLNSFGFDSTVFAGTCFHNSLSRLFEEKRIVDPNYLNLHNNYLKRIKKPGVVGCFYSHWDLWNKCVELNETIFIFEDDVSLKRNYIPVNFKDVLILSIDFKTYRSNEEYNFVNSLKHFLEYPSGTPKAIPYISNSIFGTSGYSVTPLGAEKLLNRYKNSYEAADFCINSHVLDLYVHNYLMGEADSTKSLTSV